MRLNNIEYLPSDFLPTGDAGQLVRLAETDMTADIGQVHIAKALTNMSVGYRNGKFLAELIAPTIPAEFLLDYYYKFGLEAFRPVDDTYLSGATPGEISWSWIKDSYQCNPHAVRSWYPTMTPTAADVVIQFDMTSTRNCSQAIMLRQELNLKATLIAALSPTSMVAAGVNFDNPGFDPVPWFRQQKRIIARQTGEMPNSLALGRPAWDALASNPNFLKHIATGTLSLDILPGSQISPAQAAQKLELDEILVGDGLYDISATPADTANLQWIWGDYVLLQYKTPAPGLQVVTLVNTFLFTGGVNGQLIRKWYDQDKYRQVIDAMKFYAQKLIVPTAGLMWSNAVATADIPSGEATT